MMKSLIKIKLLSYYNAQIRSTKKKTKKGILLGFLFLYIAIVFFGLFFSLFGEIVDVLHQMNLDWLYFSLLGIIIILFCFIGSVFYVHQEIYNAKDNDLLLSMPIKNRDILLSRLFSILLLNYLYESCIALPAFVVYITHYPMRFIQIIFYILTFITLPFFVVALSSFFSWIMAHILIRVKYKNILTLILSLAFFGAYMYGVNSIEQLILYLISQGESIARAIEQSVFPLYHLGLSLAHGYIMSFLIYLVCVLVPFMLTVYLLSRNFIQLATTKSSYKEKDYVKGTLKGQNVLKTLVYKEAKHFVSSATIMLNTGIGCLMELVLLGALFINKNEIMMTLNQFMQYFPDIDLMSLCCFMCLTMNSMNIISASSISLEGVNLWIIKSLPLHYEDVLKAKALFHLLVCCPFGLIFTIGLSFFFNLELSEMIIVILSYIIFIIFVDFFGLLINCLKPKFDWKNETVCVKQSFSVTVTMFSIMALCVVVVGCFYLLSRFISMRVYCLCLLIVFIIFDIILYYILKNVGVKQFEKY